MSRLELFHLPAEYYRVYSYKEPSTRTDRPYCVSGSLAAAQASARERLDRGLFVRVTRAPDDEVVFDSATGIDWPEGRRQSWFGPRSRHSLLAS